MSAVLGLALVAAASLFATPYLLPGGAAEWLRRPLADDAYYYLVIARNLAQGHGVTYEGVPVNGFQPLYFLVCVGVGALTGWHETATPAALTAVNWLAYNLLGPLLLVRLCARAWPRGEHRAAAFVAVFLWVASVDGQRAALNGLETAWALLAWLLLAVVLAGRAGRPFGVRDGVAVGAVLGGAFLVRNDAVLLSAAFGVLLLARAAREGDSARRRGMVAGLAAAAAVTLLLASPWLLHNLLRFGSVVPMSGHAEAVGGLYDRGRAVQLREVLRGLAAVLFPLPLPLSRFAAGVQLAGIAAAGVAVGAAAVGAARAAPRPVRWPLGVLGVALALLALVYATLFGAPHMVRRWLAPGVVVGVLLFTAALAPWLRSPRRGLRLAAAGFLALALAGRAATLREDVVRPTHTNTRTMLDYLRAHPVPGRVAAFQTGLLSWAVPGVSNIDGKVSPGALEALRSGRMPEWVLRQRFDALVDQDLFGLDRDPAIRRAYERDPAAPPDVIALRLRRPGPAPSPAPPAAPGP